MGRFKFRGWWPAHEEGCGAKRLVCARMYDHEDLFTYGGFRLGLHGSIDRICGPDGETWGESTGIILMQSTGLLDKNRKEIFEGDVIRFPWERVEMGSEGLTTYTDFSDWQVKWDIFGWFPWSDEYDKGPIAPAPKECEVIGNIYENPELLKH